MKIAKPVGLGSQSIAVVVPAVGIRPRLGDRFYLESVFIDIFGPEARVTTETTIFRAASVLNGPCDVYEQVRIGESPESLLDPRSLCPGGRLAASLPLIGSSNMLRQAYITRTCEILTASSATLSFALTQIFSGSKIHMPNEENLVSAFRLFNPEREPNHESISALMGIDLNNVDPQKRWSEILFSLCVDPEWQMI